MDDIQQADSDLCSIHFEEANSFPGFVKPFNFSSSFLCSIPVCRFLGCLSCSGSERGYLDVTERPCMFVRRCTVGCGESSLMAFYSDEEVYSNFDLV